MAKEAVSNRKIKKSTLVFSAVFIVCLLVLTGMMYFLPKFRQVFFGDEKLRPAALENGEIEGNIFADVAGSHPNALAITYLKSKGIVKGYEDGSFKPDELITRGETMKLVVGALHVFPHHVRYSYCFKDVNDEWFAPYVCYAREREWVSGSEDNMFYPGRNISGAEFLKIAVNVYNVYGLENHASDDPAEPWYKSYVSLAGEKGWLDVAEGENFDPQRELTRAQLAEILYRVMQTDITE